VLYESRSRAGHGQARSALAVEPLLRSLVEIERTRRGTAHRNMLKRHSAKAVLEGELERLVGTWGRPMSNHDTMDALIGVGVLLAMVLFAVASYATDKIALICSNGKEDDYSLSIDLGRKLASFHMPDLPDADDIPITRVTDNHIWFQNKALSDIYSEGTLDRITGSLHLFHRYLNDAKDHYLRCKPAKPL
jgi:hypothetical protein